MTDTQRNAQLIGWVLFMAFCLGVQYFDALAPVKKWLYDPAPAWLVLMIAFLIYRVAVLIEETIKKNGSLEK